MTKKGLLIIDMQKGGFKPETPRLDKEGVVDRINRLADAFRRRGDKVVFIQHDGTKQGRYIPGTEDWEILPEIRRSVDDLVISKTANDPFYQSELQRKLEEEGIQELIITGWATDFCVDAAVRSAVNKDFKVVVVSDGHTTGQRPALSAEQVIAHHNWIWENLTPTKEKVRVVEFARLLEELSLVQEN